MKIIIASLLLHGFIWAGGEALATTEVEPTVATGSVYVVSSTAVGEDADEQKVDVYVKRLGTNGDCDVTVDAKGATFAYCAKTGDEPKVVACKRVVTVPTEAGEGSAWMGVWLSDVPEALVAQLDLDNRGLLITKVEEDSPASSAGLQAHDIILSVNEADVPRDVAALGKLIRSYEPGDEVTVSVLRSGKNYEYPVVLGARPQTEILKQFNFAPGSEIEELIETKGRVFKLGPKGEWLWHDLEDLKESDGLKSFSFFGDPSMKGFFAPHSVKVITEGDSCTLKMSVEQDGSTLMIVRDGDGEITVTRTDGNGEVTEQIYANEEELKAGDEEAYNVLSSGGTHVGVNVQIEGLEDMLSGLKHVEVWKDWQGEQRDVMEALEEAQQEAQEAIVKIKRLDLKGLEGLNLPEWVKVTVPGMENGTTIDLQTITEQAVYSFKVEKDGTIELRINKDDTEVVQLYADEEDLARRNPEMAARYRETVDSVKQ